MDVDAINRSERRIQEYKKKISLAEAEIYGITKKIEQVRLDTKSKPTQKKYDTLQLQIEQEMKEEEIETLELSIVKAECMIADTINNGLRKDGKISAEEYTNQQRSIKDYRSVTSSMFSQNSLERENVVLEMQIEYERVKEKMGICTKDEAEKAIESYMSGKSENAELIQTEQKNIAKEIFEHKKRTLYHQKNRGEISNDEFDLKLTELRKEMKHFSIEDEIKLMGEEAKKNIATVEKEEQTNEEPKAQVDEDKAPKSIYKHSYDYDTKGKHSPFRKHSEPLYVAVYDKTNKEMNYELEANGKKEDEEDEYVSMKLAEEYSRYAEGDKADLSQLFAKLERRTMHSDQFGKSYADDQINLLQLEKVDGIKIEGVIMPEFNDPVYVATYERQKEDSNEYEPLKEYYWKNKSGELERIGIGNNSKTKFTVHSVPIKTETNQITLGDSIEKVTQREMADRLIKNGIEDSLNGLKVTEVSQITDPDFLEEFAEQMGFDGVLYGRTFLAATVNEKGEEDYELVYRDDGDNSCYKHFDNLKTMTDKNRDITTTTGLSVPGQIVVTKNVKTLKEFETSDRRRYAISRDGNGRLGLDEIIRENGEGIKAAHISSFSLDSKTMRTMAKDADVVGEYENALKVMDHLNEFQKQGKDNSQRT